MKLSSGQAVALCRRLPADRDPLDLYAALCDGGRRHNTFLLERSAGPGLLVDRAALRLECRGRRLVAEALTDNGRNLLVALDGAFAERIEAQVPDRLELVFPPIVSDDPQERLVASSPFDVLRFLTGLDVASREEPFTLACTGIIAFDHVDLLEDVPAAAEDALGFPDFLFWMAESLLVFELGAPPRAICTAFGAADAKASERAYFGASQRLADLVARCGAAPAVSRPPATRAPADFSEVDHDDEAFSEVVTRMKGHISAGEVYQIVPSRTFRAPCPDPLATHAALRTLDPSPYHFFAAAPDHVLFGASPETSVRVFALGGAPAVEVKPIAGTKPRGACPDEDDRLEAEMRTDVKELAEHMMLVDLARNDIARVSVSGTRRVAVLLGVERYARVMHLVSSVIGKLRPGLHAVDALKACLNVGTLAGAPKIRATQLLRETERTKRGPYGGAVGWINGEGEMDTSVVIRSAVVKDGTAFVRAGAGIVHDSDPIKEADETRRKAAAILSVLAATGVAA
jgi:anthranilate synthase component 1